MGLKRESGENPLQPPLLWMGRNQEYATGKLGRLWE